MSNKWLLLENIEKLEPVYREIVNKDYSIETDENYYLHEYEAVYAQGYLDALQDVKLMLEGIEVTKIHKWFEE